MSMHQAPDSTQNEVTAASTPTLQWIWNLLFGEGRSEYVGELCVEIKRKVLLTENPERTKKNQK